MNTVRSGLLFILRLGYKFLARTPLRRIPGMLGVSNALFRLALPMEGVIEVQGSKMYMNFNDPNPSMRKTFLAYATNRAHEPFTTALFKKVIRSGDVVIDLGANIGYFSLLAAPLVGNLGRVFAFEPEPTNFSYLARNISLNQFANVSVYQKAASDRRGLTKLFICSYDSGHHTINQFEGIAAYARGRTTEERWVEIETVRLDDFLADEIDRVDVVKIDVEGSEALALAGMEQMLRRNPAVKLFVEFFPMLLTKMGSSPQEFARQLLYEFGFHAFAIGREYSLSRAADDLIRLRTVDELHGLLRGEDDHINLFLVRE